ncbi:MAG TPA: hydrogenase expression/formation protein HypE [Bacteroidia bacterium]|nr:hydrogenase expression/formation protein HypE [Bacteroidia bacterium]HRS59748.1 hydrogenase expression/formation protein HypE [Bacteroidia bacterium]HRU69214.1 hydrogenase expression/formation protein HypE [Bacteroidia bacterium]
MKKDKILLGHGSGGKLSHDLIEEVFFKHFSKEKILFPTDSSILNVENGKLAFTTDSFVVDPIFFPGGNIGKLAICGTVNDLAVAGARPMWLSAGFIIEEGFMLSDLEIIVKTMASEAEKSGVSIVTGDTKVVGKGFCDKIFINTSGIGFLPEKNVHISKGEKIEKGDLILINGNIAEHGMAVLKAREISRFEGNILSDCTALNKMIWKILGECEIKFMRDATRGGLATVISELVQDRNFGIELWEEEIPVTDEVRGFCELLGYDPMYVANEGKIVMVVSAKDAEKAAEMMRETEEGKNAAIIGKINDQHKGMAVLKTAIGGRRVIDMLSGEQLPRIC